ncbi:MAG: Asp23/Gls24 family envelope stress response protein [Defluviitaleaceae bacterium]|nr:Asp23/Gls24 family envelope stress response protein [Defluviitaleaceae bacterium]MCL2224934.1 Asp23/Gls24 family envelope stress response protein [Defluviitaleaceae bacterium]MCL2262504.1 Asp23/Gls24 family envelope stress response protein [Defluviitaleaceae bacterium]
MTEIKKESGGFVRIADEVLMKIAGTAALEADGVSRLTWRTGGKTTRKNPAKCTSVAVKNRTVTVGILIAVCFGAKIHEVTIDVQKRVKSAIETMTGLTVADVNVTVGAIVEPQSKA